MPRSTGDAWRAWMDAPLPGWACVLGWFAATAVFLLLVRELGGFGQADTYESVFTTWAIANGHAACAFPRGFNVTAPLYPLVSAGVVAFVHVGRGTPFPDVTRGNCDQAFVAINSWSLQSGAIGRTLQAGVVGWLALLGGSAAVLRACGRGRTRWEPATVILLAVLPPVWICVQSTFHPEDLLALGLALGAVACAVRGSQLPAGPPAGPSAWVWAGILVGLAVLAQQFAALVAVPLFFVAPPTRRTWYVVAASATVAAVATPLLAVTSGSAFHAIFLGTGVSHGIGGALVSLLHLHAAGLVLVSRVLPLVVAGGVAWWMARRLGSAIRTPIVVLSLVAFSLGLRLIFEQQVFGYYFMALTVVLVLLDVARRRLRSSLVAWLCAVPAVYVTQVGTLLRSADLFRICVIATAGVVLVVLHAAPGPWGLDPWTSVGGRDRVHRDLVGLHESAQPGSNVALSDRIGVMGPGPGGTAGAADPPRVPCAVRDGGRATPASPGSPSRNHGRSQERGLRPPDAAT